MKRFAVIILLLLFSSCSTLPDRFVRTDYAASISLEEVLRRIENKKVIFIGEIHAKPSSHRVQLEVIKHLHDSGRDVSIAIEIFPVAQQKYLNAWINNSISIDKFAEAFNSTINVPFEAYEDIFEFARQNRIPMIGIDAARKAIADVSKKGIKIASSEFLEKIKYSDCIDDPEYIALLGYPGNRNYHQKGMPFLCDAQRMRDAVMAYNVSRILSKSKSTVVVMVGMVHAVKIAVPAMLQRHMPVDYVVLMPGEIKGMTNNNLALGIADYIWY